MYPGLFGEDSLMNLTEARDGPVSVWFTAWWIYVIRFVTFGTRAIPLLTLFGVLTLTFAVRYWAAACLPEGASRALARSRSHGGISTSRCAHPERERL